MPARWLSVSRPDLRAERQEAVGLALGERRIGEQRSRHRLQRERHAQLLDHVGFAGEIEVRLHRARPVHHVEAERADLRHVGGHDLVAALRHLRHVAARPVRRHADAEKADAQRLCHLAHLREMRHQLGGGLMHVVVGRARQLELAARLQRDGAAAGHVEHADDVVALHDRLPAEQLMHAIEQGVDAALAGIRYRPMIGDGEGELLVLGADAELCLRLAACFEPGDEFVARLDRASCRPGHEPCRDFLG